MSSTFSLNIANSKFVFKKVENIISRGLTAKNEEEDLNLDSSPARLESGDAALRDAANAANDANDDELNPDTLVFSYENLSPHQINQLKKVERTIRLARAYSLFFYAQAGYWYKCYWGAGFLTLLLTAANTIANVLFSNCSNDSHVKEYNIILGACIMACLSGLTFLDPSVRRRDFEDAADKYNTLANNLSREAFFVNKNIDKVNLEPILDKYNALMSTYGDRYYEPSPEAIDKIMKGNDFSFSIKLKL
jgi:hypothetical protein